MARKSLRFKLTAMGVLAVLIPVMVIGVFALYKASDALTQSSKQQAVLLSANVAAMLDLVLTEAQRLPAATAADGDVVRATAAVNAKGADRAGDDIRRLGEALAQIQKTAGANCEDLFVADANGKIVADGKGGRLAGIMIADREYYVVARNGKANAGNAIKSRLTGNPVVPLAAPIVSDGGTVIGVAGALLDIAYLSEKIGAVKVGQTGYAWVINAQGIMVIHPNKKHILALDMKTQKGMETIIQKMLAQQQGLDEYTFEGFHKIAGFAPVKTTGWSVGFTQNSEEFLAAATAIRNIMLIVASLFLIVTVIGVLIFAKSLTRPINESVESLHQASGQLAGASGEVSSASQSLAEGASESAAALEETSSSLEELSSMTRLNADNAQQANALMKETNKVVAAANASMEALRQSMAETSRSSEATSKIVKTIDEIAFQTNLLALNAAVEAARAGSAGSGFAVVAGEVRALALRAAEAAKSTAELIEGTVKTIQTGVANVEETDAAFAGVVTSTSKVGELVEEIAAASKEQASGIDQINKAVSEMDKVTQQNAANAEESASAAEELNAQAAQLKDIATKLDGIIMGTDEATPGGGKFKLLGGGRAAQLKAQAEDRRGRKALPIPFSPREKGEFKDF